nr:glycoside hydrolase [Wenyingzhuangia aestuarii]
MKKQLKHTFAVLRLSQLILLVCISSMCFSQNSIRTTVNQETFDNYTNTYNYTYLNNNWKSSVSESENRSFTNHTSSYSLNINYDELSINSLLVNDSSLSKKEGFSQLNSEIFPTNYQGDINYAILQNGAIIYDKSNTPTGTDRKDSQMAEYGTWCNRRFVSVNFNGNPAMDTYYTGIDFSNWHNRFKITFHVKPTAEITNGQLQLSIDIPTEYNQYFSAGQLHAFAINDKGFVVKGGTLAESVAINGNTITVTTTQQNLLTDASYEVSILFYAITDNIANAYTEAFEDEKEISITASQTAPSIQEISEITYSADEGIHYIDIPGYSMGYRNCTTTDVIQNINLTLENSFDEEKRVKLCINQQRADINTVGFNAMICNSNGDPSGLNLQVSKNWHNGNPLFYSGHWIKEYTEIMIPANTTMNLVYKKTGAKWGETYAASSHQLSIVGTTSPRGGWLEAALGSFGETITHSTDYELGDTTGADIRPFLVTNGAYGGTSTECGWTGNVGGIDMFVYSDDNNTRNYYDHVKTDFKAYSPNLTETSISSISEDEKLKFDYTFYLNRSDDFTRIYYKINVEALENAAFNRFDIFQLGGDRYNIHNTQSVAYGNDTGLVGQFNPTNDGSNDYTTSEIALTGDNPWVWAGDGLHYDGAKEGLNIDTNNGMIIRDYKATFAGTQNNTPYLMERSSSLGFSGNRGTNPTSYCLVTPPEVTSFTKGDKIELLVEVVVLPKQAIDYYGPNENFLNALTTFGNSHELLYRESLGNKITAESSTNTIHTSYPLTIETSNNTGLVTVTGGKGYIPIVFSGLSSVTNPVLWRYSDNCWEIVDQSLHGKDFWQANYNPETASFDLVYNINQDIANDEIAVIQYYLGSTPPDTNIVIQSKINDDAWTLNNNLEVNLEEVESIVFAPAIREEGITSNGIDDNWQWIGPSNFTQTGRVVRISPIAANDLGEYIVTYTDETNCSNAETYTITDASLLSTSKVEKFSFTLTPIPVKTHLFLSNKSLNTEIIAVKIYDTLGQVLKSYGAEKEFNVSDLASGIYVFSATFENGTTSIVRFVKK